MGAGPGLRALVKVNLTLHVGGLKADGYHPVSSACVFPDVGDEIALGRRDSAFSVVVDGPEGAALQNLLPKDNLVLRAAALLHGRVPIAPRRIYLTKTVPAAAGIAGGTADAAAVLVLLNREATSPLPDAALIRLSRKLGADGPVCTAACLAGGGAWMAEGDGDRVRRLPSPAPFSVVLANDRVPVPTGSVFGLFDAAGRPGSLTQPVGDIRTGAGLIRFCRLGRNDLRGAAMTVSPAIGPLEDRVAALPGCAFARMSGSGGTVFGLFASRTAADRAATRLRASGLWSVAADLLR